MRLSNSKAPSKGKRHLLTSYNVNDVTERAPRDDIGNMTLMARRDKQDFILCFATKLMLQSCFPVTNEVQTTLTPIFIPDNNTHELRNNVNPTNKKFNFLRFFLDFLCSDKKTLEMWEKNNPS